LPPPPPAAAAAAAAASVGVDERADGGAAHTTVTARIYIQKNLYSPRNGSNTKTQHCKHTYKQNESNDQVYHK